VERKWALTGIVICFTVSAFDADHDKNLEFMKLKSRKSSFVATEMLDSPRWEWWIQEASSLWLVQCLGSAGTCNYGKEWIWEEHTVKGMSLCTARSFTVCSVCMLSFHSNATIVWTAIYDH
jgi:hypothetical protein